MSAERLSPRQVERYQAQLALPDFGAEGQLRLAAARVLLVGVGGLGCPAALYLTAAGVGTLRIVDDDIVDASNLQRQVLFTSDDPGRAKVDAARERLEELNPDVTVEGRRVRVTAANVRELVRGRDLVLDGSDNFATRYVVNDACVLEGVPLVSGSLYRYEGQVLVVRPGESPCYRCLFRTPPPEQAACHEAGVLGALAGIIGTIQAAEATRLLVTGKSGLGDSLLLVDAASMEFRRLGLGRDPECPLCGESPQIVEPTAVTEAGRG